MNLFLQKKRLPVVRLIVLGLLYAVFCGACSLLPMNSGRNPAVSLPVSYGFEAGTFEGFNKEIDPDRSAAASIVNTPVFEGTRSARLQVQVDDLANHGNRAELALYNLSPFGQTLFYGWRFFIPTDDPADFKWQILAQWYQLPDFIRGETFDTFGPHPPVVFAIEPTRIVVQTNVGGEKNIGEALLLRGTWNLVVFEISFKTDATGYVRTWLNGTPITLPGGGDNKVFGPTLYTAAGTYWKLGLYRGANTNPVQAPSTNTVYIDSIRIGRTYAEVAP